jgi:hypothetical protein
MLDRLGVTHYSVNVTPVTGAALADLKNRVSVMKREVDHLMRAINRIENGINCNNSRSLTDGVMDSRNWSLSVVMSHCYIQTLLGANPGLQASYSASIAEFQLYSMFNKAAKTGADDGIATRQRLNVRPTDISAQVHWDGRIIQ